MSLINRALIQQRLGVTGDLPLGTPLGRLLDQAVCLLAAKFTHCRGLQ
jgi:hypothetical protein